MKNILLLIVCLLSTVAQSQKWYAILNGGLGSGMLKTKIDKSIRGANTLPDTDNAYEKDYIASMGNGAYANIIAGYNIDSISFVEAGVRFWNSSAIHSNTYIYWVQINKAPKFFTQNTTTGQNLFLTASYGFKFPIASKIHFRPKIGLICGKSYLYGKSNTLNDSFFVIPKGREINYEYEYKSRFCFGFTGSVAGTYILNEKISLIGELFYQLLSTKIVSRKTTSYNVDGQDKLDQLSESEKNIEYYNGRATTHYFREDVNGKRQPLVVPMNAWGITIGLLYNF